MLTTSIDKLAFTTYTAHWQCSVNLPFPVTVAGEKSRLSTETIKELLEAVNQRNRVWDLKDTLNSEKYDKAQKKIRKIHQSTGLDVLTGDSYNLGWLNFQSSIAIAVIDRLKAIELGYDIDEKIEFSGSVEAMTLPRIREFFYVVGDYLLSKKKFLQAYKEEIKSNNIQELSQFHSITPEEKSDFSVHIPQAKRRWVKNTIEKGRDKVVSDAQSLLREAGFSDFLPAVNEESIHDFESRFRQFIKKIKRIALIQSSEGTCCLKKSSELILNTDTEADIALAKKIKENPKIVAVIQKIYVHIAFLVQVQKVEQAMQSTKFLYSLCG